MEYLGSRRRGIVHLILVNSLFVFFGCSEDKSSDLFDINNNDIFVLSGCKSNYECKGGRVCKNGECVFIDSKDVLLDDNLTYDEIVEGDYLSDSNDDDGKNYDSYNDIRDIYFNDEVYLDSQVEEDLSDIISDSNMLDAGPDGGLSFKVVWEKELDCVPYSEYGYIPVIDVDKDDNFNFFCDNYILISMDKNGIERWRVLLPDDTFEPAEKMGGDYGYTLVANNYYEYKLLWVLNTDGTKISEQRVQNNEVNARYGEGRWIDDKLLYLVDYNKGFYTSLLLVDIFQKKLWEYKLQDMKFIKQSKNIIFDGQSIILSMDNYLYSISIDGKVNWNSVLDSKKELIGEYVLKNNKDEYLVYTGYPYQIIIFDNNGNRKDVIYIYEDYDDFMCLTDGDEQVYIFSRFPTSYNTPAIVAIGRDKLIKWKYFMGDTTVTNAFYVEKRKEIVVSGVFYTDIVDKDSGAQKGRYFYKNKVGKVAKLSDDSFIAIDINKRVFRFRYE